MASLSAVYYRNHRLVPHGDTGWKIGGVFHPDLPTAIEAVREKMAARMMTRVGKGQAPAHNYRGLLQDHYDDRPAPDGQALQEQEDQQLERRRQAQEERNDRTAERRMREI